MKLDLQAACAFAQMGVHDEARCPGNLGGWSEELELNIKMAEDFTKAMVAKGSSYYPDYDLVIDNWYDEMDKFWTDNAAKYFHLPNTQLQSS